ncbi:MAG: 1,4-beta-xylanase, partial [Dyella sp.]|nr:1,4-beta-xylanase [Dyella sp.]
MAMGLAATFAAPAQAREASGRWTPAEAKAWYDKQPWPLGSNYLPANAINELEMWQADTFDAARIDL